MVFESFSALWSMDGHGSYVWFCYGISALVLLALVMAPARRRRLTEQRIRAVLRREQSAQRSEG
ncbi:heme exporter protein CcmD [Spongiibacter sp. IMCC21906]|uniref:heme exporter protein CcmD n=1 Tax=Spongiibacter sp. IMCC21906 TaxID=1620392 RepID=UPI00062E0ABC|nr:heme exporter protein CcmD [Spongiibacter sp. IMCC21906]AKH69985.1 heme exporter protein CcmD [Spongiibacter sp. IMCC21906]